MRDNRPHDPGAIVLGANYRGLGVVRSLGRRGAPVWLVLSDEHRVACSSRYAGRSLRWPPTDAARVAWLLELGLRHGLHGWVLFPTDDETLAFIARHEQELAPVFRLASAGWETTRVAYDKRETHRRAARLGIPQPWTVFPGDVAALETPDLRLPAVVKPAAKPVMNRLTTAKAWRVTTREELLRRYEEASGLMDPDLLMVQELIPGGSDSQISFAALCRDGEVLASVSACRLRQRPMDFGQASTYVVTVARTDGDEHARRLLADLRFTGIVEVEFKRDARDGLPKLLDVNARIWGWHTLCERAGVDFPGLWWDLLHGRTVEPVTAEAGVRWVRMATDLPTALAEIAGRRMRWRDYLRSLRAPLAFAIFARDDPLPALLDVPILAGIRLGRTREPDAWAPAQPGVASPGPLEAVS